MSNFPQVNDIIPNFSLPTNGGGHISLSDLKGQKAVIYFYPKDDTPGCTTQAIAFGDHKKAFDTLGVKIIGVSKDSVEKHDKFIAKRDLKVTLISDADGKMVEDYGVWVEKNMYGKKYMGIQRATLLVDRSGKVIAAWPKVKVKGHVEEVLAAAT
ncbi:thioredoxin-dependent thiol peroxidase [Robiginitomaculum antarcticum]|uniref:thioredoxin-dependent thiol peroxidase n=1 Tax=Robiginitomaculum antarcticum TaxID=437507 RepID=UPI0003749596|nr:thioredoxin-dependent thiol peroxidase [Robiginitomaculum antarcticum]